MAIHKNKSASAQVVQAARLLEELGISASQLDQCKFSQRYASLSLQDRPILLDPTIQDCVLSKVFPLIRYLLLNQIANSDDLAVTPFRAEACRELAIADTDPYIRTAIEFHEKQRAKAKAPRKRNYILSLETTMAELVQQFSREPETAQLGYLEAWPQFYSYLDEKDLDPEEVGDSYKYNAGNGKRRPITFTQFKRLLRIARRKALQ